jgi:hypothetical protein
VMRAVFEYRKKALAAVFATDIEESRMAKT